MFNGMIVLYIIFVNDLFFCYKIGEIIIGVEGFFINLCMKFIIFYGIIYCILKYWVKNLVINVKCF